MKNFFKKNKWFIVPTLIIVLLLGLLFVALNNNILNSNKTTKTNTEQTTEIQSEEQLEYPEDIDVQYIEYSDLMSMLNSNGELLDLTKLSGMDLYNAVFSILSSEDTYRNYFVVVKGTLVTSDEYNEVLVPNGNDDTTLQFMGFEFESMQAIDPNLNNQEVIVKGVIDIHSHGTGSSHMLINQATIEPIGAGLESEETSTNENLN